MYHTIFLSGGILASCLGIADIYIFIFQFLNQHEKSCVQKRGNLNVTIYSSRRTTNEDFEHFILSLSCESFYLFKVYFWF